MTEFAIRTVTIRRPTTIPPIPWGLTFIRGLLPVTVATIAHNSFALNVLQVKDMVLKIDDNDITEFDTAMKLIGNSNEVSLTFKRAVPLTAKPAAQQLQAVSSIEQQKPAIVQPPKPVGRVSAQRLLDNSRPSMKFIWDRLDCPFDASIVGPAFHEAAEKALTAMALSKLDGGKVRSLEELSQRVPYQPMTRKTRRSEQPSPERNPLFKALFTKPGEA